jgi:long-subunit acyl-CoA synthetase (AMP-forming)
MELTKVVSRLASWPENLVESYDGAKLVRRPFPQLLADVRETVRKLAGRGVTAGMRVAVLATNSYQWVVHSLALIELRACLVSFPHDFRKECFEALGERYELSLLLISSADGWGDPVLPEWVAWLDRDNEKVQCRSGAQQREDLLFEEPALIFSSGTSGKLKCMVVSRRGTEDLIQRFGATYPFGVGARLLIFLPLSNYQQQLMVYAALWYGADLILADPLRLFDALKRLRPTHLIAPPLFYETIESQFRSRAGRLVPWLFQGLLRLAPGGALGKKVRRRFFQPLHDALGGNVRLMLTGMAPIKPTTLDCFAAAGLPLLEVYGLTETGTITWNTPNANRRGSVGRAIEDGSVSLAEDGEILVRKRYPLTHRYLYGDDRDNAQTYRGDNCIATGDIGYFSADGYLYLTGRKKDALISAGGEKLHPELLESRINQLDAVARAAVIGRETDRLVAVVCLTRASTSLTKGNVERLVEEINRGLPSAFRICKIVFTNVEFRHDNGLLTRNLKLDRQELLRHFGKEIGQVEETLS